MLYPLSYEGARAQSRDLGWQGVAPRSPTLAASLFSQPRTTPGAGSAGEGRLDYEKRTGESVGLSDPMPTIRR